ncbi:hypothetical protein M153_2239900064 [Pseudoloma neurophilia]|uniref:GRAM domain-containing protein n=1 Tax=Pseudoloma neurophilia TaxID=146866 RepID=A0A0R0LQQ1_9MICR|nr:hypothetical protein M153_2239900064 [Pseudoloma neurophilia]
MNREPAPRISDNYHFFNNCIFTPNNTPLPVSDDEKIVVFYEDVKFYCEIGNGALAGTIVYKSNTGKLFLTNYRLIYLPSVMCLNTLGDVFKTFHCSLTDCENIEVGKIKLFVQHQNISVTNLYFDINDGNNGIFTNILYQKKQEYKELRQGNGDSVQYFYSDVVQRANNNTLS